MRFFFFLFSVLLCLPSIYSILHSDPTPSQSSYYYPDAVHSLLTMVKSLNVSIPSDHNNNTNICWRDSYGRGVGHVIDTCPSSQDKSGALCYTPCKDGYHGVGPVCWEKCQEGYTDEGALCAINLKIIKADNRHCPWYDKCGLIHRKSHCSVCPDGYHNDGCTCRRVPHIYAKKSYGRGVGSPLQCASTEEEDASLCYPHCKASFNGVGPVCWHGCPANAPVAIGALCCENEQMCEDKIEKMATGIISAVASAVLGGASPSAIIDDIKKSIDAILQFVLPICQ